MTIRDALDAELTAALRRRDTAVVRAVRSALTALPNAEAPRVPVTEAQQQAIVRTEIAELGSHAERLARLCRWDEADGVRRGMQTLARVLDDV